MIKKADVWDWDREAPETFEEAKILGGQMVQGFLRGSNKRIEGNVSSVSELGP